MKYVVFNGKKYDVINGILNLANLGIDDITKIKNFESLKSLENLILFHNNITKISGLEKLSKLKKLNLNENKITEIEGLEELKNLEELYLGKNQIIKIKNLESLKNLKKLDLSGNKISEIEGLENLINLIDLNMRNNQIYEIKKLNSLNNLEILYLDNNQISEIKRLDSLKYLKNLSLNNNQISEIKGLESLINLQNLNLEHNKISKIQGLENLSKAKNLYLFGNNITELNGLECLKNLDALDLLFYSKVNNYITIKWIRGSIYIYVSGDLLQGVDNRVEEDIIYYLLNTTKKQPKFTFYMNSFREYISNYQILKNWVENNYNPNLLDEKLLFPLLNKLYEVGDSLAKKILIREITKRFISRDLEVMDYLVKNSYLKHLNRVFREKFFFEYLEESDIKINYIYDGGIYINPKYEEYGLHLYDITKLEDLELRCLWSRRTKDMPQDLLDLLEESKMYPKNNEIENKYYLNKNIKLNSEKIVEYYQKRLKTKRKQDTKKILEKIKSISNYFERELLLKLLQKFKHKLSFKIGHHGQVYYLNLHEADIKDLKIISSLKNLEVLSIYRANIRKIEGLKYLKYLRELNLIGNRIKKIEGLETLHNLISLNLDRNIISEIKGLDNLINLDYLRLSNNRITEIKELDNLKNLRELYLENNQITEIKGFDKLENIHTIDLSYNQISEIKELKNLITLRNLYLTNNQITEFKGINGLINLSEVNIFKNPITKILPIEDIPNLQIITFFEPSVFSNQEIEEIKRWAKRGGLKLYWEWSSEYVDEPSYNVIVIYQD